jgi:hypothetical protein
LHKRRSEEIKQSIESAEGEGKGRESKGKRERRENKKEYVKWNGWRELESRRKE